VFEVAGYTFRGTVGSDGWLHLRGGAAARAGEPDVEGLPWPSDAARATFEDGDVSVVLLRGGWLSRLLAQSIEQPVARAVAQSLRAAVVAWRTDTAAGTAVTVLVDSPLLQSFTGSTPLQRRPDGDGKQGRAGAAAAKPGAAGTRSEPGVGGAATRAATAPGASGLGETMLHWGSDVTRIISFAVTPTAARAVLPLLQHTLGTSAGPGGRARHGPWVQPPAVEGIGAALTSVSGQLEAVSFGSPADWAVAVPFADAAVSADMVPRLQRWLAALASPPDHRIGGAFDLESALGGASAGEPAVLHARAGPALQGPRVTHVGRHVVVVRQRSRLQRLFALQRGRGQPSGAVSAETGVLSERLDIPLTLPVRELLDAPAAARGYAVLGNDGALTDWLSWGAGHLAAVWRRRHRQTDAGGAALASAVDAWLARLPAALALRGLCRVMTYDVAFAADIRDSALTIDLRASEV
jgi:hypothetical protein